MQEIGLKETDKESSESILDEILVFQKSAIYRQCLEYKRLYNKELSNSELLNSELRKVNLENSELKLQKKDKLQDKDLEFSKVCGELKFLETKLEIQSKKLEISNQENVLLNRRLDRYKIPKKIAEISKETPSLVKENSDKDITEKEIKREITFLNQDLLGKEKLIENLIKENSDLKVKLQNLEISKEFTKDVTNQKFLEEKLENLKKEIEIARDKLDKSQKEVEELKGNNREFQKNIVKEEGDKRKKLLQDLKVKEVDNARLRKERDSFKYKYDLKNKETSSQLGHIKEELFSVSERQKVCIKELLWEKRTFSLIL
jgi:chromosome segregation ATPase